MNSKIIHWLVDFKILDLQPSTKYTHQVYFKYTYIPFRHTHIHTHTVFLENSLLPSVEFEAMSAEQDVPIGVHLQQITEHSVEHQASGRVEERNKGWRRGKKGGGAHDEYR